ncbi:MAG: hypothetical protein H8D72_01265 [Planctomycetes bacterium]|nr:hypothetical protein [Planctomycetota bacterium]
MKHPRFHFSLLLSVAALVLPGEAQTPTWEAEFLGAFPASWTGSKVIQDFNDAGQVVGHTTLSLTRQAWYGVAATGIQLLPLPAGTDYSEANEINTSGLIGGQVRIAGEYLACIWKPTPSGYVPMVLPPAANGWEPHNVTGLNDRGDLVGKHGPLWWPYYWNETEGTVPISFAVYPATPTDINNEREVIGYTHRMDLDTMVAVDLGDPVGVGYSFQYSELGFINDAGDCAGYGVTGSSSQNKLPVRYTEGVGWKSFSVWPMTYAGVTGLASSGDTTYFLGSFGDFVYVDGVGSLPLGSVLDPSSTAVSGAKVWPMISRGSRLIAEGTDIASGQSGLVLLSPASFDDLGGASTGSLGTPILGGFGDLTAGSPTRVRLSSANKSSVAFLGWSLSSSPLALFGGVLHVNPAAGLLAMPVDAHGRIDLTFAWPPLPAGVSLFLQAGILDAGAVSGVALSNALLGTTK